MSLPHSDSRCRWPEPPPRNYPCPENPSTIIATTSAVVKDRAYNLAAEWTAKDYQSAGKWHDRVPQSPVKSAAVSAHATTTYPYDPPAAMQWLKTLPQGPDRNKALETIYQSMALDSDTAKAFARERCLLK